MYRTASTCRVGAVLSAVGVGAKTPVCRGDCGHGAGRGPRKPGLAKRGRALALTNSKRTPMLLPVVPSERGGPRDLHVFQLLDGEAAAPG